MKKYCNIILFLLTVACLSCTKDVTKSDKKEILTFSLKEQIDTAKIDNSGKQISILVSSSANLKKLCPQITISEKATIKPASGDTVDFSTLPVAFTVTADDNSVQEWKVYVYKSVIIFRRDLNNCSISSIAIDKYDNKWIGTDSGLYRSSADGYVLEDITGSLTILSLFYEEKNELLWVGSSKGISKVAVSQSGVIDYENISTSLLSDSKVQACYSDSNSRHWFGTSNGLTLNIEEKWKKDSFTYNKRTKKLILSEIDTLHLSINSISSWDGDYYFTTNGSRLFRAENFNDSLDAFTGATQWDSEYNGHAISDTMFIVFIDSKGQHWMGGKKGIQVHTGHKTSINTTTFVYYKSELPDSSVHAISEDVNGKIWVGTEKGLTVFDGAMWTNLSDKLSNTFVTAIAFDKLGNAWIGTKKGLVIINPN
jgi:ligand-binding sensor domain-containing protein